MMTKVWPVNRPGFVEPVSYFPTAPECAALLHDIRKSLGAATRALQAWVAARETIAALRALDDGQLDDIGIDRSEITATARRLAQAAYGSV